MQNRDEPSRTEIPISIPSISPPEAALSEENKSDAPPPNANKVTPAKLSDIFSVFEML